MAYKIKPNLNISIYFDDDYFVTGDLLKGTLELNVEDEFNLRLREIYVELTGYEEINFQKANGSKVFLSTKIYFQGPKIKPSAAVRGPAEYDGFWNAVQGKTIFNFAFKLPKNVPGSFSSKNNDINVKYLVTGNVQYHQDNIYDSLSTSEEALVLESIDEESMSSIPLRASTHKKMLLGSSIRLEGIASQSYFYSGKNAQIEVHVTNNTKHKIHGLKANLYRSIIIPESVTKKDNKYIVNSISDINFKSNEYVFNSNEKKSVFIQIPIPENNISMMNASLFSIQYYIRLSLNQRMFSKSISVNLSISICNSKLSNYINSPIMKSNTNKNMNSTVSSNVLAPKKTFFNNLRSLSRKASVLKSKALISKLCIYDGDDYIKDQPKRRSVSRLTEVNFPSNYDTIKRQNNIYFKNKDNLEDVDSFYDCEKKENNYNSSNSYSMDTSTEYNTISNMNIDLNGKEYNSSLYDSSTNYYTNYDNKMETEPNRNLTNNSYIGYDNTNNSNSYLQNEKINAYTRQTIENENNSENTNTNENDHSNNMDLDEDTSDSEITETENAYNSDIDKFSKYFSNKKVFRSLSADNNSNYNNISANDHHGLYNEYDTSKINHSITYINTCNYENNNRSNIFETSSIKSKDSGGKSKKNRSSSDIRLSNSYGKNKSLPNKSKISSSNLKKVSSIETMNDDDDITDYSSNIMQDYESSTFLRNGSPYLQSNENSYSKSYLSNGSRILNTSRNNITLSNEYSYNKSHDHSNEAFDTIFNESSEIDAIKNQNSIISSSYTNITLNRNNSFRSNSSFSNRKIESDNISRSSITSPFLRYSNNTNNMNNQSFENRGDSFHSGYHNKSSPLINTNHNSSLHRSYYNNEVNMNNLNFTQNCSFNNHNNNNSSTIISNNINNSINSNNNNSNIIINTNSNSFTNNNSFNNNSSYQSPRSLTSSPSSPPFSKIHFNENIDHSKSYGHSHSLSYNFGSSSPITPTIKHKFSNSSKKSSPSVDDSPIKSNHLWNTNSLIYNSNTINNNNNNYMKQVGLSPRDLPMKSKTEKSGYRRQSHYKSSSYSTPPLLNSSSPYSLTNYVNQFQRRPSLKYH